MCTLNAPPPQHGVWCNPCVSEAYQAFGPGTRVTRGVARGADCWSDPFSGPTRLIQAQASLSGRLAASSHHRASFAPETPAEMLCSHLFQAMHKTSSFPQVLQPRNTSMTLGYLKTLHPGRGGGGGGALGWKSAGHHAPGQSRHPNRSSNCPPLKISRQRPLQISTPQGLASAGFNIWHPGPPRASDC
jgi:hypothetical protein